MAMKDTILEKLEEIKTETEKEYNVKRLGLFGSYIRSEETLDSDIDILVEFNDDADLLDLTGLILFLEEKLNHKVDVVSKRALRKEIRELVLEEVAYI